MSIGRYVKRMQDHVPLRANVIRRGDDSVEIRWNPAAADPGVTLYRGDSPDRIEIDTPVAHVNAGHSVMLSGLDPGRPHFFKLVAADGAGLIVGERRPAVEGAPNLRDLGGYEAKDGRCVKWGTIFRSSNLARLTDRGSTRSSSWGSTARLRLPHRGRVPGLPTGSRIPRAIGYRAASDSAR